MRLSLSSSYSFQSFEALIAFLCFIWHSGAQPLKNSPQCLHFIAVVKIVSPQKGHGLFAEDELLWLSSHLKAGLNVSKLLSVGIVLTFGTVNIALHIGHFAFLPTAFSGAFTFFTSESDSHF